MKLFSKKNFRAGFTLIELLVIIAIIGVMAGAVVVAVNPLSKLNSAKLANVKTFSASVENALIMSQVGKWSFNEEGGKAKDASGYGNDGTLMGGVARQTSDQCGLGFGGCMSFDGTGDYIQIDQSTSNFASSFTIEAWVYKITDTRNDCSKSGGINCGILGGDTSAGAVMSVIEGGKLWCYFLIGGQWRDGVEGGKVPLDQWTHTVCAYDGANVIGYVNGSEVARKSGEGSLEGVMPIFIGKTAAHSGYWPGLIDEVKIYNKALLSYQIKQLYAQGLVKHLLALK